MRLSNIKIKNYRLLIDAQIIDILQKGKNFRVEAGAGSRKTYSLNKVIDFLMPSLSGI